MIFHTFLKRLKLLRRNCTSKTLHFLQITAKQQDCPFFYCVSNCKNFIQNISKTLVQFPLKLQEHRDGCWRKKLPWTILEEQFPVPRNTAATKIGNGVVSLLWQLRCHCHTKFSSSSNTTVVCCGDLGGIDPKNLYRATLTHRRRHRMHSLSIRRSWGKGGGEKNHLSPRPLGRPDTEATVCTSWIQKLKQLVNLSNLCNFQLFASNIIMTTSWVHNIFSKTTLSFPWKYKVVVTLDSVDQIGGC